MILIFASYSLLFGLCVYVLGCELNVLDLIIIEILVSCPLQKELCSKKERENHVEKKKKKKKTRKREQKKKKDHE